MVWARRLLHLMCLESHYSICKFPADADVRPAPGAELWSMTRTVHELCVVCPNDITFADAPDSRSDGWRCLQIEGAFDLHETGVLASVIEPLAAARISVFALATFDTDFILIREGQLDAAVRVLEEAGHTVHRA